MRHLKAVFLGVLLDLILGDPHWIPHPVRLMGRTIIWLEKRFYPSDTNCCKAQLLSGFFLVLLMVLSFGGGGLLLMWCAWKISPTLAFCLEVWLSAQLLAARQLQRESMAVYHALTSSGLPAARKAVSMIVGRDTQNLDEAGVVRATVETVAENTSDGVVAPLLYLILGGVPLGLLYKAINTMDSMLGYQNERYQCFGRCAARLDDAVNLVPARLSGLFMCAAACFLPGMDGKNAFSTFFRDRKNHKSPNSAHTEAACAGALGVQLAGDASYFGQVVHKPAIGDPLRPIRPEDIAGANRLMFATEALCCVVCLGFPILIRFLGR